MEEGTGLGHVEARGGVGGVLGDYGAWGGETVVGSHDDPPLVQGKDSDQCNKPSQIVEEASSYRYAPKAHLVTQSYQCQANQTSHLYLKRSLEQV